MSPYRLSGVVYGTLLNHRPALDALGEAAKAPPYKAAPVAPVLYIKPRNTLAGNHSTVMIPVDAEALEIGANLGLVIGRTACKVQEDQALEYVAGYTIVNDISVPHDVFYRPSIRLKARDGYCPIGPVVAPREQVPHPDDLSVQVWVDGLLQQDTDTANRIRGVAQLLADVTEFMTLQPGDILMLGASHAAPRVRAGQEARIAIQGIGELVCRFAKEGSAS